MRKNLLYALFANVVTAAFSWFLLLYLVRAGSKEDVGLLALAQAIALPVHMFFTLKMRTIQATDFVKEYADVDYVSARLVCAIVNAIAISLFALILYFDKPYYVCAVIAFGISYSLAIVREYYISIMQIALRNDSLFFSSLVQGALGLLLFIVVFEITGGVAEAIFAMALSRLPAMVLDDYYSAAYTNIGLLSGAREMVRRWKKSKTLIIKSLPLGVVAIIGALFTSIPRYFIEEYGGLEQLGVYATVMSLVVILNLFANSFGQAILPSLAKLYGSDFHRFMRVVLKALVLISGALVVFMVMIGFFSQEILKYVFGGQYEPYTKELFWGMLSGCCLVYFHVGNLMLNAQRNFGVQVYVYALCALLTLVLSYVFVAESGIMGAIIATMSCSIAGFILCFGIFWWHRLRTKGV